MFQLLLLAEAANLIDADLIDAVDTTIVAKLIDEGFTSIRSTLTTLQTTSTHHSTPSTPYVSEVHICRNCEIYI